MKPCAAYEALELCGTGRVLRKGKPVANVSMLSSMKPWLRSSQRRNASFPSPQDMGHGSNRRTQTRREAEAPHRAPQPQSKQLGLIRRRVPYRSPPQEGTTTTTDDA